MTCTIRVDLAEAKGYLESLPPFPGCLSSMVPVTIILADICPRLGIKIPLGSRNAGLHMNCSWNIGYSSLTTSSGVLVLEELIDSKS